MTPMSGRKGIVLPMAVLMIPIFLLLMLTVSRMITAESRFAVHDAGGAQAFYLAEAGLTAAYDALAGSNWSKTTHQPDGVTPTTGASKLAPAPGWALDADGTLVWAWSPADNLASSYTGSGRAEEIRYKVFFPTTGRWRIECTARCSPWTATHALNGTTRATFDHAIFDSGDLSEFTRGANQTITGPVHANGDVYFRPDGSTLTLYSTGISAAGKMIRYEDAWGRPDTSGTVRIAQGGPTGPLVTMEGASQGQAGQGNAYDSDHPDWADQGPNGAMTRFGGVVKDGALGAATLDPPDVESLQPGGYYDQNAGLRISASTAAVPWISDRTFRNEAEARLVTVKQIDVGVLGASADWPSNGLIYADVPIRLVNGAELPGPLTIASTSTIYTRGDFNMRFPDQASYDAGTSKKKPAALMTRDRLFHVSEGFPDQLTYASPPTADDPSRYSGDPNETVEINAALVDGAPTVDEQNWVQEYQGVPNPFYDPVHRPGINCWANSDDLLENLGGATVRKRGSIVHLQNATMAVFSNADALPGSGITPWMVKTFYGAPTRDYGHDPDLAATPPPFAPRVSEVLLWTDR